jgi:hypothetical protein
MLPEGAKFIWFAADIFVSREDNPAFLACDFEPVLVRASWGKTIMVRNEWNAQLCQGISESVTPRAPVDEQRR